MRTDSGSYGYADFIPDDDDAGVERVKAADAIVIGKTQVPDSGYSGTGQTRLGVGRPRSDDVHAHPVHAPQGRGCASVSWATSPATSLCPLLAALHIRLSRSHSPQRRLSSGNPSW